eukprot:1939233-Pyramimonas_sp.AAC.1
MRSASMLSSTIVARGSRVQRERTGVSHSMVGVSCISGKDKKALPKRDRQVVLTSIPKVQVQSRSTVLKHAASTSEASTATAQSNSKDLEAFAAWREAQKIKSPKIDIAFFEDDVRGTISLEGLHTDKRQANSGMSPLWFLPARLM